MDPDEENFSVKVLAEDLSEDFSITSADHMLKKFALAERLL